MLVGKIILRQRKNTISLAILWITNVVKNKLKAIKKTTVAKATMPTANAAAQFCGDNRTVLEPHS
jgi:hypothetical protein